ncbi:MAG: M43 family zinc metalloprotease, partial [Saprospiraceae bacterium]|nr:M43 family zinc metalloprotease [Saprospiraceae bacterium]
MRYYVVVCLILLLIPTYGQDRCGFDQKLDKQFSDDPLIIDALQNQERHWSAFHQRRRIDDDLYIIPVVVHILHQGSSQGVGSNISDAQVFSAIEQLNQAFAGTGRFTGPNTRIQFAMAGKSPDCKHTSGIVRVNASSICAGGDCYQKVGITANNEALVKKASRWPSTDYLNIWVVHKIDNNSGPFGVQGFAEFPGGNTELDGVVIQHKAFGYDPGAKRGFDLNEGSRLGTILIHEVGHSLGLYHSFEGDDYNRDGYGDRCPSVDGCGLFNGDCVADTPPHRRSNGSCRLNERNICDGGGSSKLFRHNFMDYSGEQCQTEFTQGQVNRMRAVLATSRRSWGTSNSDLAILYPKPRSTKCSPQTLNLSNSFGLGAIEFRLGTFVHNSGNAVEDGGYVDSWCSIAQVKSRSTYPIEVLTGSNNVQNVRVYCDYNDDGDFEDGNELLLSSDKSKSHSGLITIPNVARKNRSLRLRVISSYSGLKIDNPCFQPYYGQVEDYAMVIDGARSPEVIAFDASDEIISWTIENDFINKYYELERANDSDEFKAINTFTSYQLDLASYQVVDKTKPVRDLNSYYRLKMVDQVGNVSYSQVINVTQNARDEE